MVVYQPPFTVCAKQDTDSLPCPHPCSWLQAHRPTHFTEFATLEEGDIGVDISNHFN